VNHPPLLSRLTRVLFEQGSPLVSHMDAISFFLVLTHGEALGDGVLDQGLDLVWEDRVAHVPEIVFVNLSAFSKFVWEQRLQLRAREHLRVPGLHGELVVARYDDLVDVLPCEEPLPANEHGLQVIFSHLVLGRKVKALQQKIG